MDADSSLQQTLPEYFAPSKKARVWRIVLAALTTLAIVGAAYELTKPQPEPVRMTHDSIAGANVYLDVQLLSDRIYDSSGDDGYIYYEAMDSDQNWYFVSLRKKTFSSMQPYLDAYYAYFTDDYMNYDYPATIRLTGMAHSIGNRDASQLAARYGVTNTEVTDFFGSNFFNEGASSAFADATPFLIGVMIFGLFLLAVAAQLGMVQRNYKKSDARLYEAGLLDEAESQFSAPESVRFDKAKLILSKDFAYSGSSGWVLPYGEIGWLYVRKQRSYGVTVATHLMAGLVGGKTIYLAARYVSDAMMTDVAQTVLKKNPDCLIGYSFDNIRLYGQRVREYKQSHPK